MKNPDRAARREKWRIFVGRGFSHDINAEKSERLQPLKFRLCF
jgi:hypothetical protein